MKKAGKDGAIAIKALPKKLHSTLKVFDVDDDGTVAPGELARAAELYQDSKNQVKRLTKLAVALILLMGLMLLCIFGLVVGVVEMSKETKTASSGIQTVKGSSTPVATGTAKSSRTLYDVVGLAPSVLREVKELQFTAPNGSKNFGYTITGYLSEAGQVTFYAARGDRIVVTKISITIYDPTGNVFHKETPEVTRRKLLQMGPGSQTTVSVSSTSASCPISGWVSGDGNGDGDIGCGCAGDADCKDSLTCDGICIVDEWQPTCPIENNAGSQTGTGSIGCECVTTDDCAMPYTCQDGYCEVDSGDPGTGACSENKDCTQNYGPAYTCQANACIMSVCTIAADCSYMGSGYICDAGECVTDPNAGGPNVQPTCPAKDSGAMTGGSSCACQKGRMPSDCMPGYTCSERSVCVVDPASIKDSTNTCMGSLECETRMGAGYMCIVGVCIKTPNQYGCAQTSNDGKLSTGGCACDGQDDCFEGLECVEGMCILDSSGRSGDGTSSCPMSGMATQRAAPGCDCMFEDDCANGLGCHDGYCATPPGHQPGTYGCPMVGAMSYNGTHACPCGGDDDCRPDLGCMNGFCTSSTTFPAYYNSSMGCPPRDNGRREGFAFCPCIRNEDCSGSLFCNDDSQCESPAFGDLGCPDADNGDKESWSDCPCEGDKSCMTGHKCVGGMCEYDEAFGCPMPGNMSMAGWSDCPCDEPADCMSGYDCKEGKCFYDFEVVCPPSDNMESLSWMYCPCDSDDACMQDEGHPSFCNNWGECDSAHHNTTMACPPADNGDMKGWDACPCEGDDDCMEDYMCDMGICYHHMGHGDHNMTQDCPPADNGNMEGWEACPCEGEEDCMMGHFCDGSVCHLNSTMIMSNSTMMGMMMDMRLLENCPDVDEASTSSLWHGCECSDSSQCMADHACDADPEDPTAPMTCLHMDSPDCPMGGEGWSGCMCQDSMGCLPEHHCMTMPGMPGVSVCMANNAM
eukprot:jgi/Tetstr1/438605/TSEL_027156.t1